MVATVGIQSVSAIAGLPPTCNPREHIYHMRSLLHNIMDSRLSLVCPDHMATLLHNMDDRLFPPLLLLLLLLLTLPPQIWDRAMSI